MQLPDVNLDTIDDPVTRAVVRQLLNLIEGQATEIATLQAENQHLRDALARLKGGSGKPDMQPSVKPSPTNHSSEAERQTRTPRGKPKKNATLTVTREARCVVDRSILPPDARFNGTRDTIVQDLRIEIEVIRFVREEWFVPATNTTMLAPLPAGYQGAFGPTLHALIPALGHDTRNVSQPALLHFLRTMGVSIGTGTVARLLADATGRWADEARAIHQAGLASGAWVASDQTATRVDGQNEVCHVVGNRRFTSYHTRPGGTRQDVLAVLWGQEPRFRLNDVAVTWLMQTSLPAALRTRLVLALSWDRELTAAEVHAQVAHAGLTLGRQQQQPVFDALAIAAYHAQTTTPRVDWLLSDDAAVYDHLSAGHGLCWIHDWRHYAKLRPVLAGHQRLLDAYRTEYGALYRALRAYRETPTAAERARLADAFDTLIDRDTGYAALDDRISKTADKRAQLLAVLELPDIPLHNNDMELAARRRVRKRDVSFGPQSRTGARAWDTFQTIAATAAKHGVGLFHYLHDRLVSPQTTPSLAERIAEHSRLAAQPAG
jgi:hypothetical protein